MIKRLTKGFSSCSFWGFKNFRVDISLNSIIVEIFQRETFYRFLGFILLRLQLFDKCHSTNAEVLIVQKLF